MSIYIAGPMRGYENFNKAAFATAEAYLYGINDDVPGYEVFNPARIDEEAGIDLTSATGDESELEGFDLRDAMAANCVLICRECTQMYMLKGWEFSAGARAEHALAVIMNNWQSRAGAFLLTCCALILVGALLFVAYAFPLTWVPIMWFCLWFLGLKLLEWGAAQDVDAEVDRE